MPRQRFPLACLRVRGCCVNVNRHPLRHNFMRSSKPLRTEGLNFLKESHLLGRCLRAGLLDINPSRSSLAMTPSLCFSSDEFRNCWRSISTWAVVVHDWSCTASALLHAECICETRPPSMWRSVPSPARAHAAPRPRVLAAPPARTHTGSWLRVRTYKASPASGLIHRRS